MNKNNALVSGILGEPFKLEMMIPQRYKEAPKQSEGIPFLLLVTVPFKKVIWMTEAAWMVRFN